MIRKANRIDIPRIIALEQKYYEGSSVPPHILQGWISTGNFYVFTDGLNIKGSIFYEFLSKPVAIPYLHEPLHQESKNFVYVSDVAAESTKEIQELFSVLMKAARAERCQAILWLTGSKKKHDQMEREILKRNLFKKLEDVKNWECWPDQYTDNHSLYIKELL